MSTPKAPRRVSAIAVLGKALGVAFRLAVWAFVVTVPVLGVWIASSLAAYVGRATWLAVAVGAMFFPILPLAWELYARHRRKKRKTGAPTILTTGDRMILRTLVLNAGALVLFVGTRPEIAFEAISTRGDWMLDGVTASWVRPARGAIFASAGHLEWLYRSAHARTYRNVNGQVRVDPGGTIAVHTRERGQDTLTPTRAGSGSTPPPAPVPPVPPVADDPARLWPRPPREHSAIAHVPAEAEASVEALAHYLAGAETDPKERFKLLHDWVADRITYDVAALESHTYPPQDPSTVLRTRTAVCAGYANLLEALGKAAGFEIEVVVGDARTMADNGADGMSHAWNAVRIDGHWQLVDATWDAGGIVGGTFSKRYRTDYLFTPPEVFGVNHFPEEDRWQLRSPVLTRGDFMRQPLLAPAFAANHLKLEEPTRSQVTVRSSLDLLVENPLGLSVLGTYSAVGDGARQRRDCQVEPGRQTKIHCMLPQGGTYEVAIFASRYEYGSHDWMGSIVAHTE